VTAHDNARRPFDLIGDRYDAAFTDRTTQIAETDWLVEQLAPGARVLDLGCGSGVPTAQRLGAAGLAVTCVDESAVMLELAAARAPSATLLRADMRDIGQELGEFDAATAFFSLLMLSRAQIDMVLRAVRDRLRGPGLLALAMVAGDFDLAPLPFLDVPMLLTAYPADAFAEVVTGAGFDVVAVTEVVTLIGPDHSETQLYLRARAR
jgi:SAM-dependent methyltransferase